MGKLNLKASILLGALPALAGVLFSGCGGSSGGSSQINSGIIAPTNYTLTSPANGALNTCTAPLFTIHFPTADSCGITDLSTVVGVIPQGYATPVPITTALQTRTADGGCDYNFNTKAALPSTTPVSWGVFQTPGSSASTLLPNTSTFTTGASSTSVVCGVDNGARFIVQNIYGGSSTPQSTAVGSFGTFANGSFNANFPDLGTFILGAMSANLNIFASTASANTTFSIQFNQPVNPLTIAGSINVSQLNATTDLSAFRTAVTGIQVKQSAS
ncbi:MAG: hypothetical protein JWQ35_1309, partial [Bacteriovoracaceae bacterium]|nr:hypothetical protein [Bacteriovoracaceae bacterium]